MTGYQTRRAGRTAAIALSLGVMLMLGACSDSAGNSPSARNPGASQLSEAIAFRDGDPTLTITNLEDGAVVLSPFTVNVEVEGFRLAPAGSSQDGFGHWHLLIDRGCAAPGDPIPSDEKSIHIGSGEDSLVVDLPAGTHELCAQIGDGFHVAVAISDSITVEVLP